MWILLCLLACRSEDPPGAATRDAASSDALSATSDTSDPSQTPPREGPLRFSGAAPRNVLMISMDTFRKDHIDPYGDLGLTPNLGRYLAEGVHTTNTMQCSNWTMASTSCTLLGRDPVEHGFLPRLEGNLETPYPDGTRFLAVELADAGYQTVITSRNGFLGPRVNNVQGYGTVLENLRPAETQLAGALNFLKTQGDGSPWFVHVHAVEPHAPYDAPQEFAVGAELLPPIPYDLSDNSDVNALRADDATLPPDELALAQLHVDVAYQAEVRWLDDQIGRGLEAWDEAGLLDDTLVVFWTDHGEQLWEHGNFTHAYDLNYGENDALFALWAKGLQPGVWTGPVSAEDIAPTVLSVVGVPVPDAMTGFPLGTAPDDRLRRAVSVARGQGHNALRRGDLKLIFRWTTGELMLYDKAADPQETTNRFDLTTPEHAALWLELRDYVEATEPLAPDVSVRWEGLL